jgi:hypothetical protein
MQMEEDIMGTVLQLTIETENEIRIPVDIPLSKVFETAKMDHEEIIEALLRMDNDRKWAECIEWNGVGWTVGMIKEYECGNEIYPHFKEELDLLAGLVRKYGPAPFVN